VIGGKDLLIRQIADAVASLVEEQFEETRGHSEIERLFEAALVSAVQHGLTAHRQTRFVDANWPLERLLADADKCCLIIERQCQVAGWRVDFLIRAWDFGTRSGRPGWARLIVECDGHDFHERTRLQAMRDRGRDRAAQQLGIKIFRFTGSELWGDPMGCVEQVNDWAQAGWP
jgi:very-short-patch-repair endonuclease